MDRHNLIEEYKKFRRKISADVHLEEYLNNPDTILIFQKKQIIGVFQGGGVDFIENTSEMHKFLGIRRLLVNHYIDENLAEVLIKKYCYNVNALFF